MKKNSRIVSFVVALTLLFLVVALISGLKSCVDKRNTENSAKAFYKYEAESTFPWEKKGITDPFSEAIGKKEPARFDSYDKNAATR